MAVAGSGEQESEAPQAFGGWLIALLIFQCLLLLREGSLTTSAGRAYLYGAAQPFFAIPAFSTLNLGRFLLHGAFSLLVVVAITTMVLRKRIFRKVFRVEMICFAWLAVVDFFWVLVYPVTKLGPNGAMLGVLVMIVAQASIAAVWLEYARKSVRMRTTFTS